MIEIALNGLKIGLVLTLLIGPVFFTILQASVERGFWVGVMVAIGVSLSDIFYVAICYLGFSSFMTDPGSQIYMGYAGGCILIAFGLYYVLVKSRKKQLGVSGTIGGRKKYRYLIKGFVINAMNPMVAVFWIGTVSLATIDFGYTSPIQFVVFFGFVLGTVLSTDIAKAFLSEKLRQIINYRSLMILHVIMGIALILFGGRLIFLTRLISLS